MGAGALPARALSDASGDELSELAYAVGEGAGFPAVARAASRVLGASLAVVDRSSAVLAIAAASPEEEGRLRARGAGVGRQRLRAGGEDVGELRLRWHGEEAGRPLLDLVAALMALELERSRSGEWADEESAAAFVDAVLERELTTGDEILAQAAELGAELGEGAGVVTARIRPGQDAGEDWPARAVAAGLRGARAVGRGSLAALGELEGLAELRILVPCEDTEALARAGGSVAAELGGSAGEATVTIGTSRHVDRPDELFRAGREALLALNVAEAEGAERLAFEETGSYRLLLSAMSENPGELEWFYNDTVAPLLTYDQQYGTDLVSTVETFLRNDGNIGPTADEMFAHRHTIRYRLGRVRDLCGYDIQSTDGRERLGFGLKVMRVMGIGPGRSGEGDLERGA